MEKTHCTIKTCSVKTLAIFLSVLMIFYLIPATAYASPFEATDAESVVSEPAEYTGEIFEDINRREENVKHFRLEDGTYMAAQYDTAVHSLDENGEWQNIDNTLYESGSEYSTSNARVKFAKKITGNESIFTLHENNRKITLSLDGAIKKTSGMATNTETEFDETATTLQKMMTLDKLSSRIIYEDIIDGVDLEYIVISNNVKENIIVKEQKDAYSYSFTLKLHNLSASLSSAGDVEITDPDSDEVLYIIPAPVVYDANMTYASETDAYYTLETIGQNEYRLTVSANTSWMNASERAFPVTIDPAIYHGGYGMQQMCDTCVSQKYPSSVYGSRTYLKVGYDSANANLKAYVAMRSLPTLPAGSMITNAELNLTYNGTSEGISTTKPLTLVAKKIIRSGYTSLWTESSTNYNTAMTYSDILDYQTISSITTNDPVKSWNITSAVVDWYADSTSNQGIAIMQYDLTDTSIHTIQFHSSDYSMTGNYTPFFTIAYVSTIGVESYYSYQSANAGLAGTGYVNTATGALSFVKSLLSTTDSLMPYTVSMTYNSDFAGKAYQYPNAQTAYSTSYMPYGFKLNINETIIEKRYTNSTAGQSTYYVWADSDGTEHCFFPVGNSTTVYQDEDGLQLTLTISSSTCTIADDSKAVKTFTKMSSTPASDVYSAWYLTSITDKNNNKIAFTFDSSLRPIGVNLTPNGSSTISFLTLAYNSDGHLSMIRNDTSKEAIVFRYSSAYNGSIATSSTKYLREIVYAHGTSSVTSTNWTNFYNSASNTTNITVDAKATYTYDSAGQLTRVVDTLSGYRIDYTYSSGKVIVIQEYGSQNSSSFTAGQKFSLTYSTYNTVVRTSGTDDTYGTSDDLLTTYYFDAFGRTVNCYTTDLNRTQLYSASSGQYVSNENEKAKNSLKSSVQTTEHSSNYLLNGGFDKGLTYWSISGTATSVFQMNSYCAQLTIDASNFSSSIMQNVNLPKGSYSLSAYINSFEADNVTVSMTAIINGSSVSKEVPLNECYASGDFAFVDLDFTVDPTTSGGTEQVIVMLALSGTSSSRISVQIDRAMLSKTLGAAEYDMTNNGHFDGSFDNNIFPQIWSKSSTSTANISVIDSDTNLFGNILAIDSDIGTTGNIYQVVYKASDNIKSEYNEGGSTYGTQPVLFTVYGWGKGSSQCYSDTSEFELVITVTYYKSTGSTSESFSFEFNKEITDWQFISGAVATNPDYGMIDTVSVEIRYSDNPGVGYFDGISVLHDSSTTAVMDYNAAGYMTSYQNGAAITCYDYYDSSNNVRYVISSNMTIVEYEYDSLDRVTKEIYKTYKTKCLPNSLPATSDQTLLYYNQYVYNRYGQVTTITVTDAQDENKQSISTISYNTSVGSRIFGSVAKQTDTLGKEVLYFYDNDKGYLLAQIAPDGNGIAYQYDDLGFLDIAQPAVVNTTKTGYTDNTSSSKVDYDYDSAKRLSKVTTNATSSRTTVYSFTYDNFGNNATISVGNRTLASYSYNANNGKLKELTYGNGLEVNYIYDTLDRISEIQYNIGVNSAWLTVYSYTYDTSGNLFSVTDHINDEVTMLHYDAEGKLIQSYVYDSETYTNLYGSYIYYDEHSRVYMIFHSYDYAISGGTAQSYLYYAYDYNETNGSIELLELSGDYVYGKVNPAYDNFGRTSTRTFDFNANDTDAFYNKLTYDYVTSSSGYESSKVSKLISEVRKGSTTSVLSTTTYNFTYDDNGNIKKITNASGTTLYEYSYDALGQLIRENNQPLGYTYVYEYDNAGNITAKKRYDFTTGTLGSVQSTINYTYGDSSWGDLLTKFGNTTISYDTIGNPISIGAQTLTWQGRRLTSWNDGEYITVNFGYNADSIRTYKEITDSSSAAITRHEYVLSGTQIIKETVYENSSEAYTVIYLYDENGSPIGIKYRTPLNAESEYNVYFFEKNLQGDIVAVYNSNGTKIGAYTYDAWGSFSITTTSGITTLDNLIVRQYNPFRYRGYYYDSELGFYYLNSRYYDPAVGRFINADALISTGQGLLGYNMFAYCSNCPVMLIDPAGEVSLPFYELPYPGLVHMMVIDDIIENGGGIFAAEVPIRINNIIKFRIDIRNTITNTIYEVKPETYYNEYRLLSAVDQLDNYVCHSNYTAGVEAPFLGIRVIDDNPYLHVEYWYEGQGIILYRFYPKKTPIPKAFPAKSKDRKSIFSESIAGSENRQSSPAFSPTGLIGLAVCGAAGGLIFQKMLTERFGSH